jgi:hypothetical protein
MRLAVSPVALAGVAVAGIIGGVVGGPARSVDALIVKTLTTKAGGTIRLPYERAGSSHPTASRWQREARRPYRHRS